MRRLTAAALTAALLAAGCTSLEPRYVRPAAPVPGSFPHGDAYARGVASASDPAKLPWREVFIDPRLRQVVEAALANNRDLRVAAANIESARALYRVQRAAQLPYVSAGANATALRAGGQTGESYGLNAGVSSFELDLFGRVRSLSQAALQRYLATEEAARATRISLMAETANTWLTLAADRSLLRIARQTASTAGEATVLSRQRLLGGIASQLDLSQSETILEQARSDLADLTTQVAQDRNALELLVGAPVADDLLPPQLDDAGFVAADVPAGISSETLLRRPDVLQAENQLRATNANIGAARANFFPRISLTGVAGLASSALSGLFTGGAFTFSVGPSVSLPIFDGGANRSNLAYSEAQRTAAIATYERSIQVAFRDAADALARRGTIDAQLGAQRRLTAAAASTYDLSSARYRVGAEGYLTVLDAQRTLYSAQRQLVGARLLRDNNLVTLYRALGGGLR